MYFTFLALIFAQTAPAAPATPQPSQAASNNAGACSQIPEFNSCVQSFQSQKVQTCDRQVQKSQEVSQAKCNLKVMQQTLSCYNFCNTAGSGDERKNYAQQVDQQAENVKKLEQSKKPQPSNTTDDNNATATATETEDATAGSRPNGNTSFGRSTAASLIPGAIMALCAAYLF